MNHTPRPEVRPVNKQQYFEELTEHAAKIGPGERIGVMSMNFKPEEPAVARLLAELGGAARRGANVLLSVDAHDFIANAPLITWGDGLLHGTTPQHRALAVLREAGAQTVITNMPRMPLTPAIVGRSHIKFGVVNDRVWLGGCNLDDVTNIDLMASWQDKQLADWLMKLPSRAEQAGSVREAQGDQDIELPTAWDATLLVDAGVRRQSQILDNALRLIDEADEQIIMFCQYFPNSVMARHLTQAVRRGVDVQLFYNHPAQRHGLGRALHTWVKFTQQRLRPKVLFAHELSRENPYLHAKLLVTEKAAMLGSHNYVMPGVTLGTSETTLLTTNHTFAAAAEAALRKQIKSAS